MVSINMNSSTLMATLQAGEYPVVQSGARYPRDTAKNAGRRLRFARCLAVERLRWRRTTTGRTGLARPMNNASRNANLTHAMAEDVGIAIIKGEYSAAATFAKEALSRTDNHAAEAQMSDLIQGALDLDAH